MEARFETRRREIEEDCRLPESVVQELAGRLHAFAQPFAAAFVRREQREHFEAYVSGLLSEVGRKTAETIAYWLGLKRKGLQDFIGVSPWGVRPLIAELVGQVGGEMKDPGGIVVFDPSAHPKKGTHSVGVARQWCGRLGKVENCQVGVYMGYVTERAHALVDFRLYLPGEWARDKTRRRECGVPRDVRFQTRHALCLEMLAEHCEKLPHAWVGGDVEMGRSSRFRGDLRGLGEQYLLGVPSNTTIRDLDAAPPTRSGPGRPPERPFQRVDKWVRSLPESAWSRATIRDAEKGPLEVDIVKRRVQARTDTRQAGPEELLVVVRSADEGGAVKHDYHLSNAPAATELSELARVANAEHRIEECLKRAKSHAGLSEYESRTWLGWHHHQALSLIATWFLTREAGRKKKGGAGADGGSGGQGVGVGHATSGDHSRRDSALHGASAQAQRGGALLPLLRA
mgnify:CR=1 FL=1